MEKICSPPFLLICHLPSVGVLFSGLAPQSFQHTMRKSGSYTVEPSVLSILLPWHVVYFHNEVCPNSISSLSSWRC